MATFENSFDGGSNGVGMTVANTGGASGDAFTAVDAALTFSDEWAQSGTLSAKPPETAVSGLARWSIGQANVAIREYVMCTVAHTGDYTLLQTRGETSSSTTGQVSVLLNAASHLRLREQTTGTNRWTAAATFPLNESVRVELLVEVGTSPTTGRARVAYYLGEDLTPIEDSGWLEGLDLRGGTYPVGNIYVGKISAAAYAGDLYVDTLKVLSGADYTGQFIGPATVPATASPLKRWDAATSSYVDLDAWRWDGSEYVPVDVSHALG